MSKELEEAITFLEQMLEEYKTFGDLQCEKFEDTDKIYKHLEIVLQALEELQQKEKNRIIGNINEIKIEDLEPILKPYYIPKKKIEETIKELNEEFYTLDKEIDVSKYGLDDRGKIFAMQEISWIIGKLQELLEEK